MSLLNVFIPIAYYIVWHEIDALSIPYWMKEPTWLEGRNRLQISRSGILEFCSLELPVCVCVLLSCVLLFATPWTVACQVPLSMEFSRQEYWSGLPFPSPRDLPNLEIKLRFLLHCRQIFYHLSHLESPRGAFKPWCLGLTPMNDLTGFKCNLDKLNHFSRVWLCATP